MTDKRPAFESPLDLATPMAVDPDMRRPSTITVGAALVLLRVAAGALWLVALAAQWPDVADVLTRLGLADDDAREAAGDSAFGVVAATIASTLLVELALAVLVWKGVNWARIVVMVFATVSISVAFVAWWAEDQEITVDTTLLTLALDILVLLALSSRSARAYARRHDPHLHPALAVH